jgi:hypothetical protein
MFIVNLVKDSVSVLFGLVSERVAFRSMSQKRRLECAS